MYQAPPLPSPAAPLVPSSFQREIFGFIADGEGSAVIIAVAGSGKTTTLLHSLARVPERDPGVVLAFNVSIAGEFKSRLGGLSQTYARSFANVKSSTFHSLAFSGLRAQMGEIPWTVESNKMRQLCRDELNYAEGKRYTAFICRLVSLAKGAGIGSLLPNTPAEWQTLIDHHDLILDEDHATEAQAIVLSQQLLQVSTEKAEEGLIDFDDQLYLCSLWDVPLQRVPWVFVDEAQDTNAVRRDLIWRALDPGGRVIAVGDPNQAIYGFTGASHDAIDQIQATFGAIRLPLSVNYRCGTAIVEHAQRWVPAIQACEGQQAGTIEHLPLHAGLKRLEASDAILCRTTAPLVETAYQLLAQGTGCMILGRDIGQGLVTLVKKLKAFSLENLEDRLREYQSKEITKLQKRDQLSKIAAIRDRVSCIRTIIDHLLDDQATVEGLIAQIERMFAESSSVLTLSTIHKAKGREWRRVAILRPDLLPGPWARQPWQKAQEDNLCYVAATRAKEALYYLI